ncbi:Nif3-like dinuclear metal center hexameric protein [Haloplasma contractile]|uniref:GTP cyclohydrolase 1 type 2 homolog n=1 Tax=Haloplasma contractile SSD-17B TaxID=1033810 RepID=U2EEN0_9MOLU|nr:Nif3-like dinuclear metal center hexameric protein [Haloplasma contractile]ERJ13423.1 SMS protein [Haloplasma contractile SSD-17B]
MNSHDLQSFFRLLFPSDVLELLSDQETFGEQYGFNNFKEKEIKKIAYSVNLTPDLIDEAANKEADIIITHHNAWDDLFEFREACFDKLKQYDMIHYFNHLPLDNSEFGPTRTLAKELELDISDQKEICKLEMMSFGVVGVYKEPISLFELTNRLETIMGHKARVWEFGDKEIKRVAIVAGSGTSPEDLRDAHYHAADVYITGEKKIKTLQYAKHMKLNFILGSHTFTEFCGVEAFISKIKDNFPDVLYIPLTEDQFE